MVTGGGGRGTFAPMPLSLPSPNGTPPDASKRPRRSWTVAEQTAYVADFAASGLSATAFCRRLGIRRATLARWRLRATGTPTPHRVAPRIARSGAGGFAAVTVVPDTLHAAGPAPSAVPVAPLLPPLTLVLRAPSGVVADVAGLDVATAAALLRAVLTPAAAASAAGAP